MASRSRFAQWPADGELGAHAELAQRADVVQQRRGEASAINADQYRRTELVGVPELGERGVEPTDVVSTVSSRRTTLPAAGSAATTDPSSPGAGSAVP
jgi:hypothetical protein